MNLLRVVGVLAGLVGLGWISVARFGFGRLRNLDWLMGSSVSAALVLLGLFPDSLNFLLDLLSFEKGGGQRLIGLLIFAVLSLYALVYLALARNRQLERDVDRLVRELAKREFRKLHDPSSAPVYVVIPAYNEEANIEQVLQRIPSEVCGLPVKTLVVVDGATDGTEAVARRLNKAALTQVINCGGAAALKAGYDVALEAGAEIVVTLDADGQHSPEELPRLVQPIVDDRADFVNGSRVLGVYERDSVVRAAGVVFFNRLVSLLTMTKITDCSNGFRAIRATQLVRLDLRQRQFHTSEVLIDALKKGLRVVEVPITVSRRLSGESKKPGSFWYGVGFARAIFSTWLR
ncbi:MAG: glycosyltransferase [Deltaproteobacteria bacterium]|nr:glycosyltransferase [Deltaproteobacteria bacterium]MBI3386898.1 glycosyltransferase [Deltaproteobacteria bacterium]